MRAADDRSHHRLCHARDFVPARRIPLSPLQTHWGCSCLGPAGQVPLPCSPRWSGRYRGFHWLGSPAARPWRSDGSKRVRAEQQYLASRAGQTACVSNGPRPTTATSGPDACAETARSPAQSAEILRSFFGSRRGTPPARGWAASPTAAYQPRNPAQGVLYQVVRDHFVTFRAGRRSA